MVSDRMKASYDRAASTEGFKEGQLVLLYNPQRKKGLSSKLQTSWDRPYKIIIRLIDVVYRIQKANSLRTKMEVVHMSEGQDMGRKIMSLMRNGTGFLK